MIALYLLAAHLVGDFVLQTRWQAAGKFGDSVTASALRGRHVLTYCALFVPVAVIYSRDLWHAVAFMTWLFTLHFFTDRQRFTSTLGDWFAWNFGGAAPPAEKRGIYAAMGVLDEHRDQFELQPSPWTPLPILIDQTLHVCQLALLGGLFLA